MKKKNLKSQEIENIKKLYENTGLTSEEAEEMIRNYLIDNEDIDIPEAKKKEKKPKNIDMKKITRDLPRPDEIKAELDKYVIGQDECKKVLSVAVYNHYKKIFNNEFNEDSEIEFDKSNILLMGPTGCGKTLLVKTIAKLLDLPSYIQNCSKLTAAGYVGDDVEEALVNLLRAADGDVEKAQVGIVMLDEIDKIATKGAGPSITRDVSGECVQQSLLKMVEGDNVGVMPNGGRRHPEVQLTYINTNNILFIASGAFVGLDDIVKSRTGKSKIGFDNSKNNKTNDEDIVKNPYHYVTSQDLRDFGFIPEFIGRFPILTNVENLDKEALIKILTEPKNSIIKQYIELLKFDNVELKFTEDALEEIADIAIALKTGARGLRSIVEQIMLDFMFDAPKMARESKKKIKINITKDDVIEKTNRLYPRDAA